MAIDFPSSPVVGQTYLYAGVTYTYTSSGVWAGGNTATGIVYTGSAAMPTSANPGDFWYDLSVGVLSVYVNDGNTSQWVQVSPVPAQPPTTVITTDALANNGLQVNGGMEISQERGATAGASGWVLDQWTGSPLGTSVISWQQVTDAPPGYNNSLKATVTTAQAVMGATDYCVVFQSIEGFRTSRLQWGKASAQPVSIGFWTKIHRPGNYSGAVRNAAANRSYPFSFTQNVADAWEYKTVTIPGDTTGTWIGNTNGVGLCVLFAIAMGATYAGPANAWAATNYMGATGTINGVAATTDTFQITGVVILPGIELPSAVKAPFIMRQWDQEKWLCKRYYVNEAYTTSRWYFVIDAGAGYRRAFHTFTPEMRAPPVVTVATGNQGTFGAGMPKVTNVNTYSCELQGDLTVATNAYTYAATLIADARL